MRPNMATATRFLEDPGSSFFLFGPRGTGKSTWLRQRFPEALWIDLLDPDVLREYAPRPERLREVVRAAPEAEVVVIDEVQKLPALLDVVHLLIESKTAPRFVLTGSSARKLRQGGVNLLGGRAYLRSMHPLMAAELGADFVLERALRHGLVPLVWFDRHPADALKAYLSLYLQTEVQLEGLVRDLGGFTRFLEAFSFSHGALLNVSDVSRECQVSRKTVEGYLTILDDLLLAFQLFVFTRRARRELVAHPKAYFFDAGVFSGFRPTSVLDRPEEIGGAALEGLVAQHFRAWIDYSARNDRLWFWRTRAGNEVDLIVYGPSGFWAIEVKASATIRPQDLRGLKAFGQDYPEAQLRLIYGGKDKLDRDGVLCWPVTDYLKAIMPGLVLP